MPSEPWFLLLLTAASVLAGGIASISGFGIGSLLTPVWAPRVGTKLAVAAVSIPHLAATALRLWLMRKHVDRRLLLSFGLMSAAGGLTGAIVHAYSGSSALTIVFGALLLFTGTLGLLGISNRLRFTGWKAWVAGAVSGMLGGLVGNQGGIRSAAMLGFDVPRHAFVATATAVGLIVDGARVPVYLLVEGPGVAKLWPQLVAATLGALVGTFAGQHVLTRLPETLYRRLVSGLVFCLGVFMLWQGLISQERVQNGVVPSPTSNQSGTEHGFPHGSRFLGDALAAPVLHRRQDLQAMQAGGLERPVLKFAGGRRGNPPAGCGRPDPVTQIRRPVHEVQPIESAGTDDPICLIHNQEVVLRPGLKHLRLAFDPGHGVGPRVVRVAPGHPARQLRLGLHDSCKNGLNVVQTIRPQRDRFHEVHLHTRPDPKTSRSSERFTVATQLEAPNVGLPRRARQAH